MYNIYKASVSPGWVQQTMPYVICQWKLLSLYIPPMLVIWLGTTCPSEALTTELVMGRTVWERVLLCSCVPFFVPRRNVLHGERETWCYLPYCISCLFSHTHTCSCSTEGRLQKSFSYEITILKFIPCIHTSRKHSAVCIPLQMGSMTWANTW
jgi:hypothetical protein